MVNNLELQRFEMRDGDDLAAFLQYRQRGAVVDLLHTETLPGREGAGYGSELVRGVLDYARERDWQVLPSCPFVRSYIADHLEYLDLVPGGERARFGLEAAN
jgi:predicted GNAT family acetyltransferase